VTGIEISKVAASLPADDTAAQDALARRVVADAREVPAAVLAAALAKRPAEATNGMYLALQLEDYALGAVLNRTDSCSAARRRHFLGWLVEGERRQRAAVLVRLDKLMADRSPLRPRANKTEGHGPAPAGRVCDEAFLLSRRLLARPRLQPDDAAGQPDPLAGEADAADAAFRKLPPRERDAEIVKHRNSTQWTEVRALAQPPQ
jgi:hypothetical protein